MKDKSNKTSDNNASSEPPHTLPTDPIPGLDHPLVTPASNVTHRETLPDTEEVRIVCFACYVDQALQNMLKLLKSVRELVATKAEKEDIEDGIFIAELTLEELLEELHLKHHGEGLPGGGVPVRPIPLPVSPKDS